MKKDKILVITSLDDSHADHIINALNESGHALEVIRLNTEDFVHNCDVVFDGSSVDVKIRDSKRHFNSNSIKSVWYRRPDDLKISSSDESVKAFIRKQSTAFLRGLYFCCHDTALWINPLPALHRSRVKMQQLQLAQRVGLKIPETIITNNADKALKFLGKHGEVCTKSLDEPNFSIDGFLFPMFTRLVSSEKEISENKDSIRCCPTLFQQYINKKFDIRVAVFGDKLFSFEIHSQKHELSKLDFRGISPHLIEHKLHNLPTDIEDRILDFVRKQNLVFSSLDLVLTDDGTYYFLENNPNGQWLWLEILTKVDLTSHLIQLLIAQK